MSREADGSVKDMIERLYCEMQLSPGESKRMQSYQISITKNKPYNDSHNPDIDGMCVTFEITYTPAADSLTYLAAKKCANSGLTAGLTADAIELVFAQDTLLAVRYLF
jgi:hypothetical protein